MKLYRCILHAAAFVSIVCLSSNSFGAEMSGMSERLKESCDVTLKTSNEKVRSRVELPPEMWSYVLQYVDLGSLYAAMSTCKKFGVLATREERARSRVLIEAVKNGNLELVQMVLAQQWVSVNAKNELGERALHWVSRGAVSEKRTEIAQLLLSVPGVEVDVEDRAGKRPLHYCLFRSLCEGAVVVSDYSDLGPAERVKINMDRMFADSDFVRSNESMICLFVEAGADLHVQANEKDTFLGLLKERIDRMINPEEHRLVELLREKGSYPPKIPGRPMVWEYRVCGNVGLE